MRNEVAAMIIDEAILPHLRAGNFQCGVDAGVTSLADEVTPVPNKEAA